VAADESPDGRVVEVERAVLLEARPIAGGARRVAEVGVDTNAHPLGDGSERDSDATARGRGQVVELRQNVWEGGATELHERMGCERRFRVLGGEVRDCGLRARADVVRSDVEKAWNIEGARPALVFE